MESNLWPDVLDQLKDQLTRGTFDACLRFTTAVRQNGALIISTPSTFGLEWLENRLRPTVEQAVAGVAGEALEIIFRVADQPAGEQPELFFTGSYRDAYNEIVQPNLQHYTSKYFHEKWLPILGPNLWLIIWEMRSRCSWDWKTRQIRRDLVEITYKDLAGATGISERIVWGLLNPKDPDQKTLLAKFLIKSEVKRSYSKKIGKVVNEKTAWKVKLDDPLTPEDERQLEDMISSTREIRE